MSFKSALKYTCLFMLAISASAACAQNPLVGKWKFNPEKSQLTGDVIRFSSTPDGAMEYTGEGRSYTFKTDGKQYTTPTDAKVTWKKVDDHTWQSVAERNGTTLGTRIWVVSPDGKTLTIEDKGTTPSGQTFDDTSIYIRVGSGTGLEGNWKGTKADVNEAIIMDIAPSGSDGVRWSFPSMKATADVKTDGKDYPAEGPTVPNGLTLSLTPTGPRSFRMVEKMRGTPLSYTDYTVSEDGSTLTDVSTPAKTHEPVTEVWDKQ